MWVCGSVSQWLRENVYVCLSDWERMCVRVSLSVWLCVGVCWSVCGHRFNWKEETYTLRLSITSFLSPLSHARRSTILPHFLDQQWKSEFVLLQMCLPLSFVIESKREKWERGWEMVCVCVCVLVSMRVCMCWCVSECVSDLSTPADVFAYSFSVCIYSPTQPHSDGRIERMGRVCVHLFVCVCEIVWVSV